MKLVFILLMMLSTDPKEIAKINSLKKEAKAAFLSENYEQALVTYTLLRDSMGIDDEAVSLNLAHTHYHLGDTAAAKKYYKGLTGAANNKLGSIALQQLGVMKKDLGKLGEALQFLKSAIKANPRNGDARYNYEVVKKLLEEQKKEDQENQDSENEQENQENEENNKNQQNQEGEQENKDNQEGENQENSEQKEEQEQQDQEKKEGEEQQEEQEQEKSEEEMTKEKLEEMGITEEKARQLLEAMKQAEIKYLQHQRRKPTKRPPSGKPDW